MATRNQVLSLFGASPEQIMQQEAMRQAEAVQAIRDPYQQVGTAIGVGLGRLFGGKSAEMQAAEQMQKAVAGIDPNDPAALRELAKTVSTFAPERALQIAAYAGELEKSQMGATVPVPTIVGYETEPDIDPLTGLQRTDENNQPLFKRNPIYRNVPFERTPDGLKSLVPGYSLPSGASTAVRDDVSADDSGTKTQPVVNQRWNPDTGKMEIIAPVGDESVETTATPDTQKRIMQQSGASRTARTGETGVGIAPPPTIEGQKEYMDVGELNRISDDLRDQITALENSKDPNKKEKIAALKKRRAEIQRLRIQSRRLGAPSDLSIEGKGREVFAGFQNTK